MSQEMNDPKENTELLSPGRRSLLRILFSRTTVILLALILQILLLFATMFSLFQNIPTLLGGLAVFTAVMLLYILNTRDNPGIKLSWAIVIAALPLLGTVLYFFCRFDPGHRLEQRSIRKAVTESLLYVPDDPGLTERLSREDRNLHNLAHYLHTTHSGRLFRNTEVTYFPLGEDAFREMLARLEQAERFIFLEYFTIGPSYMWDSILRILIRKARQGVEVRVLYDGGCAVTNLPYRYPRQLEAQGIRCKMFCPFRPLVSTHYNNRDHRKLLITDGHTAFTGGVNIQDRYINREKICGHWKDTAVMLRGEASRGFTLMFLQMWNASEKQPVYAPYLTAPMPQIRASGYVIPYGSNPLDGQTAGRMVYLNILNQARKYVYIMTPYLIPDSETLTALCFAARRGVDVRLILPHIPDKKSAFALARSHYPDLLNAGVRIYEYTPGFVHAKMFLCDDREAVVGTVNLDYRSLYLHFECGAYLYRVPALADIRKDFENTFSESHPVTREESQSRPWGERIAAAVLKLAAPLM